MEVQLKNLQKKIALNLPKITKTAKAILKHQGIKDAELSIVFVTGQKMYALNKKYLKHHYTTDILTFNLSDNKNKLVGEIIISTDEALKNAKIYKTLPRQEIILYVVHGILHLLGYDDHSPSDIKKMRAKEQELLEYVKK